MKYGVDRQFETDHIYHQWLTRCNALPISVNRFLLKFIWGSAVFLYFAYSVGTHNFLHSPVGIGMFLVSTAPLLLSLVYFLWFTPLAIQKDVRDSTLDFIFASPVKTTQIVSDLRLFMFQHTIKLYYPGLILLLLIWITHGSRYVFYDFNEFFMILMVVLNIVFVFVLLLQTGVAAAGLPLIYSKTGLLLVSWIILVLVITYFGGTILAMKHYEFWWPPETDYQNTYSPWMSNGPIDYYSVWLPLHYLFLLGLANWLAYRVSYASMERRRSGVWR
jgi:hypothetical protein